MSTVTLDKKTILVTGAAGFIDVYKRQAVSIVAYYLIGGYAMTCLLVSACLLICTIVVRGG